MHIFVLASLSETLQKFSVSLLSVVCQVQEKHAINCSPNQINRSRIYCQKSLLHAAVVCKEMEF